MVPHGRSHGDQSETVEGLGRLARRLVHHVLAVVLELRSRRESVWGLRTGVSAMCHRGLRTNVRDDGADMPRAHLPELSLLAVASGGGRRSPTSGKSRGAGPERRGRACDLHLSLGSVGADRAATNDCTSVGGFAPRVPVTVTRVSTDSERAV